MNIPTSGLGLNSVADSIFSHTISNHFDEGGPKKRIKFDRGEERPFRTSDESLAPVPRFSTRPLHDRTAAYGFENAAKIGETVPAIASIGASSIAQLHDLSKSHEKGDGEPLLSRGSGMSFQQGASQSTPEPALSMDEWGSGDFASLGPPASGHSEYTSGPRNEEGMKRKRESTGGTQIVIPPNISDDQRLLLELRDERNLPWKDIALKFQNELGRSDRVPALQMRYKRLKERLRVWTETDVDALAKAVEYWEQKKFEIVSEKMLEFGVSEKWPARHCALKWQEISVNSEPRPPPQFETEMSGYNISSQTASPGPQSGQPPYAGSVPRSSSFSTSARNRSDMINIPQGITSNPAAGRMAVGAFSPGKPPPQFSNNSGHVSQSPGMQPYMPNYSMQGTPQTMSPRPRMQSSSIRSSPGLMGSQSHELLTQPMYNLPPYPGIPPNSSAQNQQPILSDNPYEQTPPSHHTTLPQQSPSYNQMGLPNLSGYNSTDPYAQNRHVPYSNQHGSGSPYMDQQQQQQQ